MNKTLKSVLALLLSVLIVFAGVQAIVFSTLAEEAEEPVEPTAPVFEGFYYEADGTTATIVGVDTSLSGDVSIPEVITADDNSYDVTSVGLSAFRGAVGVTGINIPASVVEIADGALNTTSVAEDTYKVKAGSLQAITVDEGNENYIAKDGILYDIDETVLLQYPVGNGVTSFTVPAGIVAIGPWAFAGAVKLADIQFTDDIRSIGGAAFLGCKKIKSVDLPATLDSVNDLVFCNTGLRSVSIPSTVSVIGAGAFSNCTALSKVTFEGTSECAAIRDTAFNGCSTLRSFTVPDSVVEIGNAAFLSCSLLKVSFGENSKLASIGSYAFSRCKFIGSFALPDSVVSIGDCAFLGDFTLRFKVGEDSSLNSLGTQVFVGCFMLFRINLPLMGSMSGEDFVPGTIGARAISSSSIFVVNYAGTVEQFNALAKAMDIPLFTVVKCTDGKVSGTDKPIDKFKAFFKDIGEMFASIGKRGEQSVLENVAYDI